MFRLLLSLFSVFVGFVFLTAQVSLALGEWRSLQSYRIGQYVTESPEDIIYSTGRAIFYIDKDEFSIRRLTRPDGLSETNVRLLRYHPPTDILIIVYENSVIDLFYPDGSFETLTQIDNFNATVGDARINRLSFGAGNLVYISAGFGITALDLDDLTFQFTTFTGIGVSATDVLDDVLYAATDEGMYRVSLDGINIVDFNNWELLGSQVGLPDDYTCGAVSAWKDDLYFGVGLDVYRFNDGSPVLHYEAPDENYFLNYLSAGQNFLLAGYRIVEERGNFDRQVAMLNESGLFREVVTNCVGPTNYAIEDDRGRIWFGEDWEFIRVLEDPNDGDCANLDFDGPIEDSAFRMFHDGQALWVAGGGWDANFSPTSSSRGILRFEDGQWTTYEREFFPVLRGRDPNTSSDDLRNAVGVGRNPVTGQVWATTYLEGAFTIDPETEEIVIYDEDNSSLQNAEGESEGRVRVGNVAFDEAGNTYLSNPTADSLRPVSIQSPDGEWVGIGSQCTKNEAFEIKVDNVGYVWTLHGTQSDGGISVLDLAGTPLDTADDRCRNIITANSDLPTNEVYSMAVDLDGDVWIGTGQGIVIFECGTEVFNEALCNGRRPVVSDGQGNNAFLLETELIQSIVVDGGNQKWVGTTGGVYLLSPDGEEQLAFFDEDNSPLLDNNVRSIAVHPTDGTVFFGTEDGIIAYRGSATEADNFHAEELVVFPNPVEPDYDGPISITGLARDARVKITDIGGTLVFEGNATGGQFTWNGADYNGRLVQSGVYLIFSASNGRFRLENPDSAVGKLVIVR
ncbi:MAG: two-component regulator propeller domain-containing protein [Bacteroidota bacterium]